VSMAGDIIARLKVFLAQVFSFVSSFMWVMKFKFNRVLWDVLDKK
jgi:hypothetical protein